MRCMEVLKCDVARPISGVPFPLADKRYTICNVANDGRLDFDRLAEINVSVACRRTEETKPLWRRRSLRPTVASVLVREPD